MNCGLWTRAGFCWALAVGQCFGLFLPSPVLTVGHEPLSPCPPQAGRGVILLSGKQKQAQMLHRFSFLLAQIAFLFCLVTVSVCGGCLSAAPTLSSEAGPLAEPGSHHQANLLSKSSMPCLLLSSTEIPKGAEIDPRVLGLAQLEDVEPSSQPGPRDVVYPYQNSSSVSTHYSLILWVCV